jgi:hypothetical protein
MYRGKKEKKEKKEKKARRRGGGGEEGKKKKSMDGLQCSAVEHFDSHTKHRCTLLYTCWIDFSPHRYTFLEPMTQF